MVPTRTNRTCIVLSAPSRCTSRMPVEATSRMMFTRWSSSRFTSSMYSMPGPSRPPASSIKPGCHVVSLFSRSSTRQPPSTRSSVAPIGKVTGRSPEIIWANARAVVDFAVPRWPRISTPPTAGDT
jgi:hypothetical protein